MSLVNISRSGDGNLWKTMSRVARVCWYGADPAGETKCPDLLNNEAIDCVNAAGTATVGVIKLNASNLTEFPNTAGHVFDGPISGPGLTPALVALTTNGAIPPHTTATYVITKGSLLGDTLAAPTATTDDGVHINVTSNTAYAHTITATGLLQTGTASVNVATFAAVAGATLELMAYQGKWNVMNSNQITFS